MSKLKTIFVAIVVMVFFMGCMSMNNKVKISNTDSLEGFSTSVISLLTDVTYLKREVTKVNASKPAIQRFISESDQLWEKRKVKESLLILERALRISKNEPAIYLRLAHINLEEGFIEDAKGFAARGLLIEGLSSWERVLLSVYSDIKS